MPKHYLRVLLLLVCAGGALFSAERGTGRYAVMLTDPPVAQRFASVKGGTSTAGRSYRQQILANQASLRQELQKRNIRVTGAAQTLLNAVFVAASSSQAAQLRALPGVKAVVPLHRFRLRLDRAVQLVNAPAAWAQLGGTQNAGAGVKIAIIDTGIDQTHPGFQDSSLTPPAGFPICSGQDCAFTSNKVIVARSYVAQLAAGSQPNPAVDSRPDDVSMRDRVGHGTALAMVVAGVTNTGPSNPNAITGMAPKAFLGSYKVFGSPGVNDFSTGDVIIQALEDALNDGMDIAVLSLSSPAFAGPLDQGAVCGLPSGIPCDPEAAAVETAVHSGLAVVVAAGNDGDSGQSIPTLNTVGSPATAPSAIAAGASTNSHTFVSSVSVADSTAPQNLQFIPAFFGDGPLPSDPITAPLRDVATLDGAGNACSGLPPASLNGMFALIMRSHTVCAFATKVGNAQAAGASGVILIQESGQGDPFSPGGLTNTQIPAAMIGYSDGQALKSYLASHPSLNGKMDPTLRPVDLSVFNEVAQFSSHGPAIDMRLKPELVAVGTDMYMATQHFDPSGEMYDPTGYTVADGTSFSTPMIAGALALVKQANPSFAPVQLKSAVVNTATQDVSENGFTASVVSTGNGKLNAGGAIQAVLSVDPATVSFGALARGTPPTPQTLAIHYSGASSASLTLTVSPVFGTPPSLDKTVLAVSPAQPDQSVTLTLPSAIPSPGIYEGAITIQGAGPALRVPYLYVVGDGIPFDIVPLNGSFFDGTIDQQMATGGIAFKVIDQFGVPVSGVPVSYAAPFGGAIANADPQTDVNGIAGADAMLGPIVGNQTFAANAGGLIVQFAGFARPQPTISAVVSSASLVAGPGIAPGSYITLFGSGLSDFIDSTSIAALLPALDLVSVSFDVPSAGLSLPGRLLYVSPSQINVQAPWELKGQTSVMMKVTVEDSIGTVITVPVSNYAPAVYPETDPQTGQAIAAALDLNSALITAQNPAHRGQVIQLYLNGLGPVDNPPAIGTVAQSQPLSNTPTIPTVTIGNKQATVLFSGLTPTTDGLNQINLQLAADTPTGLQPLIVAIGGVSSPPVNISVQ